MEGNISSGRMNYTEDWDRTKLLGDAYYDSLLIEQMLIEKLGTRFLDGLSGSELTKALIKIIRYQRGTG